MLNFEDVWKLTLRDSDISQHLLVLYGLAIVSKAQSICEIGAGQSTYVLTAAANANEGQFYSVDLTKEARERLFPDAYNLDLEPRYHFVHGNSLEVVKTWDKPIDFLFIDSGHEYNLTLNELKSWAPFVKEGSFICMHDTGLFNNNFADCRRAMLDFLAETGWKFRTMDNQNGLSIIRKI